jgi:glyoxylase-like metal-dependent hydrolase (beta-lactamase superfamily II)
MSRSRRDFFRRAAAVPFAAQAAAQPPQPSPLQAFEPSGKPHKLTDNLFLFEDTCNVFVVRSGNRAVLIDFGSGKVMEHFRDMGVSSVDWILHTHHHRDQCQGDGRAVAERIPIAVPAHERHLFADAENFWRNRRVFHLYNMRNDFNTITQNIPVSRLLTDYSTFQWGPYEFFVFPTPGHTPGSITLLATIDGRRVAFSGDLLHSPGKIVNLYDTQINYGGEEGIDLGIYSMDQLRAQKPAMLCPSHGEPMRDPDAALAETSRRLRDYYRLQFNTLATDNRPYAVSPHLIASYQTTSSFYAIVSDSGKAMFIDYGSASDRHFSVFMNATDVTNRIRFVEHTIGDLKREFGLKSIDVAMPSHMHDDHMNGFPHLIRQFGTKVWCYENMQKIFENPRGYNLGCILAEPFKVDRTFRDGERFKWEEFEFEITHSPGHTEYQMALYVTLDGKRVAFTGDAFFETGGKEGALRHNLIFRNEVHSDSHLKSIRSLIDHQPDVIAPGHGRPYAVTGEMMEATERLFRKQQQMFAEILPVGETDFGMDPSWVSIYPYQILLGPGERQRIEIRVRNYKAEPMKIEAALVAPSGLRVQPEVVKFEVAGKTDAARPVTISAPARWSPSVPRFAIACDVMRDGRYLGQITEAVVDVKGALGPY